MRHLLRSIYTASQFMQLAERQRWPIVEAGFYLLCAKLATIFLSAQTFLSLGALSRPAEKAADEREEEICDLTQALEQGSLYLRIDNCLIRALALRMLLAPRSIPSELHIGARKDEQGDFAAHAWLTCGGTILIGGDDSPLLYRELVGSDHVLLGSTIRMKDHPRTNDSPQPSNRHARTA